MKTILMLGLVLATVVLAAPDSSAAPDGVAANTNASAGAQAQPGSGKSLRLNFRGASLDAVLSYLSEAAGFVIVSEAQPHGTVDVWSEHPVTREEAFELLNAALLRNGYAAIRKGRTLTIVARDEAKTRALPVKTGADPESIPQTPELVTQVIPVRFTQAAQLLSVLQPLAGSQTTMTANESANTLVITDTQENIHRLAQVIQAVDGGAEDFTMVKVLRLRNANASEMADLLSQLFPDQTSSQGNSGAPGFGPFGGGFPGGPGGFGGGPGGFQGGPGGFGPGGGGNSGRTGTSGQSQTARLKSRAKVTAVADSRTQSVVVTASRDLMPQVEAVVAQLDQDAKGKQTLAVYRLKNASPRALSKVLQDAFQKNGTSASRSSSSTENDALENRSTTQNQQNATTTMRTGRTGAGAGQGGFGGGGAGFGGQ